MDAVAHVAILHSPPPAYGPLSLQNMPDLTGYIQDARLRLYCVPCLVWSKLRVEIANPSWNLV